MLQANSSSRVDGEYLTGPRSHETGTEVQRSGHVTKEATPVQVPAEGNGTMKERGKFLSRLSLARHHIPDCSCFSGCSESSAENRRDHQTSRNIQHQEADTVKLRVKRQTTGSKHIKQEAWSEEWRNSRRTVGPRRQFALFPKEMCWHASDHRQPSNVK